jgi:hypothetical protein
VVGNDGEPCPRCGRPTEVREHADITEKLLRQRYYFRRWFHCTNRRCKVSTHVNPAYRVFPGEEALGPGGEPQEAAP